jgi:hypothetical protein
VLPVSDRSARHQAPVSRVKTSKATAGAIPTSILTWASSVIATLLHVLGERAQLIGPERFDLVEPGPQGSERFGPQPVHPNPSVPLGPRDVDQPSGAKHPKMPTHGRPRHRDGPRQLPRAPRPQPKDIDNLPPRGIGECRQHTIQILAHVRNY